MKIINEAKAQGNNSIEVMTHPAFIDNALLKSNYAYPRLNELEVLTSENLKSQILWMVLRLVRTETSKKKPKFK